MRDVRRSFRDRTVPEPTYTKAHYWSVGATYWLPSKEGDSATASPSALSRRISHPFPQSLPGLHVCGESYSSYNQAWVEGALETAEAVLKLV
jgi:monoamine oxidase